MEDLFGTFEHVFGHSRQAGNLDAVAFVGATFNDLAIDVVGNAFMHNMVRIIVGTLLEVARGRLSPGAIDRAFASLSRADLGITAPAQGLYLESIDHELALEGTWPYHPAP